ncbi:eight-cysteine-cluster domain-containing protein [Candidatus Woesearchaeota archaeon]|nr:eight-cysteine-cluster domain-containing protein [Candidatus Woesearchaeota archaeon]
MKKIIGLLFLIVLLGCQQNEVYDGECSSDTDCVTAGCSGQLCVPQGRESDTMTICDFKPEYDCLRLTSCSCIAGKCSFEQTQEYRQCLKIKGS